MDGAKGLKAAVGGELVTLSVCTAYDHVTQLTTTVFGASSSKKKHQQPETLDLKWESSGRRQRNSEQCEIVAVATIPIAANFPPLTVFVLFSTHASSLLLSIHSPTVHSTHPILSQRSVVSTNDRTAVQRVYVAALQYFSSPLALSYMAAPSVHTHSGILHRTCVSASLSLTDCSLAYPSLATPVRCLLTTRLVVDTPSSISFSQASQSHRAQHLSFSASQRPWRRLAHTPL